MLKRKALVGVEGEAAAREHAAGAAACARRSGRRAAKSEEFSAEVAEAVTGAHVQRAQNLDSPPAALPRSASGVASASAPAGAAQNTKQPASAAEGICTVCAVRPLASQPDAAGPDVDACAQCQDRIVTAIGESDLTAEQATWWLRKWHAHERPCPIVLFPEPQRKYLLFCVGVWQWLGQTTADVVKSGKTREEYVQAWGPEMPNMPFLKGVDKMHAWVDEVQQKYGV